MHHSHEVDPAISKAIDEQKLGATGRFPEGKLTDSDEGEIAFRVGAKDGKVLVEFGKPVSWFGCHPEQAIELAVSLRQWAQRARFGRNSG